MKTPQHFYIYKVVNNVNGKYYIGKRVYYGKILGNDTYLGSGTLIKTAVNKYGKENFTKIILEQCTNKQQLSDLERKYVDDIVVKDPNSYNITLGGHGGWLSDELMLPIIQSESYRQKMREVINSPEVKGRMIATMKRTMADPEWKKMFSKAQREAQNRPEERARNSEKQKLAQNREAVATKKSNAMIRLFKDSEIKDKHKKTCNSEEFRKARREDKLGKKVLRHPITGVRKYIRLEELQSYLDDGWIRGLGKHKK